MGETLLGNLVLVRTEHRPMLAAILRAYPSARAMWARLHRLGMTYIYPDTYAGEPPRVWIANCRGLTVGLVLHGNGYEDDWSLHS